MADITFMLNSVLTGGAYDGDYAWSFGANWPGGVFPTAADNVFLPDATSSTQYQAVDDFSTLTINGLAVGSFARLFVAENSTLNVGSITQINGAIQVDAGAELNVSGTIASSEFGAYDLFGGQLVATGGMSGSGGGIFILDGGSLYLGSNYTGSTFEFRDLLPGESNLINLLEPTSGSTSDPFIDLSVGDRIALGGLSFDDAEVNGNTLTFMQGGSTVYTLTNVSFDEPVSQTDFIIGTDSETGDTYLEFSPCFLEGTRIACLGGDRTVESLKIGDVVLTADGDSREVKWIGRQTVVARFAHPIFSYPIRVAAGALAERIPERDLFLSPDHALLIDGILAQAGALVNGTSITRVTQPPSRFTYFHIETEDHAVILAEGAPAETFVDNVTRRHFDNYAEFEALFGTPLKPIAELDQPRAMSARQVPIAIRRKLLGRAEALGFGQTLVA